MTANSDRFPLLRFVAWFAGLLLAATGLAVLIAQSEAEAAAQTPPALEAPVQAADRPA